MCLKSLDKYREEGLLILRIGIGIMFILHGWPKISGGPVMWEKVGMATGAIGIHFAPTFFGFMAAIAEFGGGICLVLGFYMRLACIFLLIDMTVASLMHITKGDGFIMASHAIEAAILFFSLIFIGSGKFSLDTKIASKNNSAILSRIIK